jgi:hypothetical protein
VDQLVARPSPGPSVAPARHAARRVSLFVTLIAVVTLTDAVVPPPTAQADSSAKGTFAFAGAISGTVVVTSRVCSRQLVPDLPGVFFNFVWPTAHLGGVKGGQEWHIAVNVNQSGRVTLDKASFGEGTWVTVVGAKHSDWLATAGTIDIAKGYAAGNVKVTLHPATFPANRPPAVMGSSSPVALSGSWSCP